MKKYVEYMDSVRASDTLHQRLVGLEAAGKRPVPWKKYGAMAAALALVVGAGAWGMAHGGWNALAGRFQPSSRPEIAELDGPMPDIAIAEPGDVTEPGKRTLGGYEVTSGGMTAYYTLPYIDYGGMKPSAASQVAADWDIPAGAIRRDLTQEEIAALMGGEDAVNTHLDWGGYTLTGWAAWYEDGSFWGAYIMGHQGPLDHFEFAVTADQLPPTCIVYSASVPQEIRGLTITAEGYDSVATPSGGVDASTRRVSFMKDDYGYRFDLTGTDTGLAEQRVSRLVRQVADQGVTCPDGDGSYVCANCGQTVPAGTKHSHTFIGVGEPNWNDSVPDQDTSGKESPRDRGENWCGTQGTDTETCPDCGAAYLAGSEHDCAMCDGYPIAHVCEVCGETYPEGTAHSHEACGYPLAPDTETCPDCGVTYPAGEAHYHTHTCEVCGQALPAGAEHSHQEEHHQEQHSGHH